MLTVQDVQALGSGWNCKRLKGRYLVNVNSGALYWMNEGKDNILPLLSSQDLECDSLTFIFEADGHLVYPSTAEFNYELVQGGYSRWEFIPLGFTISQPL